LINNVVVGVALARVWSNWAKNSLSSRVFCVLLKEVFEMVEVLVFSFLKNVATD
jgi:hypothetical protein